MLSGHGSTTAFVFDPDPDGSPPPGTSLSCQREILSRRALLVESALAALVLESRLGLTRGARLAMFLPNGFAAVVWAGGAKRLGIPFVAVPGGVPPSALCTRLRDTDAAALVTNRALLPTAAVASLELGCAPPMLIVDAADATGATAVGLQ